MDTGRGLEYVDEIEITEVTELSLEIVICEGVSDRDDIEMTS